MSYLSNNIYLLLNGWLCIKTSYAAFPRAHTCYSQIDLPQYKIYNELADRCSETFPNTLFKKIPNINKYDYLFYYGKLILEIII